MPFLQAVPKDKWTSSSCAQLLAGIRDGVETIKLLVHIFGIYKYIEFCSCAGRTVVCLILITENLHSSHAWGRGASEEGRWPVQEVQV